MRRQPMVNDLSRQLTGTDARRQVLAGVPLSERRLRLAGVATAVLEGGHGPPLVLLHGQGGWAGLWLPVIPELVQTHHVVAPDMPVWGAETRIRVLTRHSVPSADAVPTLVGRPRACPPARPLSH